ncbi:MAG: HAD family phosphatase [Solobacterium sp.]|nr:HAD family phosphatase [Solobacterium sp.]
MIRNILFDMGNVLVRFDPTLFVSRLNLTSEDRTFLLRELYLTPDWVGCDRGTTTEEEMLEKIRPDIPARLHDALSELALNWNRPEDQVPGMQELVENLAENGYELYLLTNAGFRHRQYWFTYPISAWFPEERIFRSADHHTVKPEQRFYEEALAAFDLKKGECVFIDDSCANAEGAVHAGLDSIVFHGDVDELKEKLRRRGIHI